MAKVKCTSIKIDSDSEVEYNPNPTAKDTELLSIKEEQSDSDSKNDSGNMSLKRKIKLEPGTSESSTRHPIKKRKKRKELKRFDDMVSDNKSFIMLLSNFPSHWSFTQVYNFIRQESLKQVEMEMEPEGMHNKPELKLRFRSLRDCHNAAKQLQDKKIEGNRLRIVTEDVPEDTESDIGSDTTVILGASNSDVDAWQADDDGLYGLKREFLDRLNIKPPLGHWVHVNNFRCDKSELRDVLELAGRVIVCSVVTVAHKYAKVMYSHPLEAVQAVSMLNRQVFYGKALSVEMDVSKQEIILPKGLAGIGPGLAENGECVRDIAREYERFLSGKPTTINMSLFKAGNINEIILPPGKTASNSDNDRGSSGSSNHKSPAPQSPSDQKNSITTMVTQKPGPSTALVVSDMKPKFQHSPLNVQPSAPSPFLTKVQLNSNRMPAPPLNPMFPMREGPIFMPRQDLFATRPFPPNVMSMPGAQIPFGPGPGPTRPAPPMPVPPPIQNPGIRPNHNWHNPPQPEMFRGADPVTLTISNLPPTTSFPSLCGKLSSLAQVTSLEFTIPGCAVVKFASPGDADRCLQNYRSIQLS